jgi:hypothetical protein
MRMVPRRARSGVSVVDPVILANFEPGGAIAVEGRSGFEETMDRRIGRPNRS